MSQITEFVIEAIHPRHFEAGRSLPSPAFLDDENAWIAAIDFSQRLGARATFFQSVVNAAWSLDLPAPIRKQFCEGLSHERMLLGLLDEELFASLEALQDAAIPVVVVKGMELGRRIYPRRIHRPMSDVDLLVHPAQYEQAIGVLCRRGFSVTGEKNEKRIRVELARKNAPAVEIHRALLAQDPAALTQALWERSEPACLPGVPYPLRVLSREDAIAYLVSHGSVQHLLETPVWLNDVHLLAQPAMGAKPIDWNHVIELFAARKCLAGAYFSLLMLKHEWQTPVPDVVIEAVGARLGHTRRGFLERAIDRHAWFRQEKRSLAWVVTHRFFLRDEPREALAYATRRFFKSQAPRAEEFSPPLQKDGPEQTPTARA